MMLLFSAAAFLVAAGGVHKKKTVVGSSSSEYSFDPRVSPHQYSEAFGGQKIGVIIVDHGSRRQESNERHEKVCEAYASSRAPESWIVRPAHMELAAPSIGDAFDDCVAAGCQVVICHPFFLGPGRHVVEDVPALVEEASARHPGIKAVVTPALGENPLMMDALHDSIESAVLREEKNPFENTFFGSIQAAIDEAAAEPPTMEG